MDRIIDALNKLKSINGAYALSSEAIEKTLLQTEDAKVCTPVIGKFR